MRKYLLVYLYALFFIFQYLYTIEKEKLNNPFCNLPHELVDIIIKQLIENTFAPNHTDYSCLKKSCNNIYRLGYTNKFFSHWLTYPNHSYSLMKRLIEVFPFELSKKCFKDNTLAAAYYLNTSGAKLWIKEQYLNNEKGYKFASPHFFKELSLAGNNNVFQFIRCVLPSPLPPLIRERLYALRATRGISKVVKRFMHKTFNIPRFQRHNFTWNNALCAAIANNKINEIQKLLHGNIDPNLPNCKGLLPIDFAISNNSQTSIHLLLENGTNPDSFISKSQTCLSLALKQLDYQKTQILLEAGANPNMIFFSPYNNIICDNDYSLIYFLKKANHTTLQTKYDFLTLLLKHGANPNGIRLDGVCYLSPFEQTQDYLLVETLLKAGANPNIKFSNGRSTPLLKAIQAKNIDLCKLFLKYGAKPDFPDELGNTPKKETSRWNPSLYIELFLLDASLH